ncbi:hypothetical protein BN873_140019 [Candidatus Competibacter denitrificans Run_A_D11]|uniref:Uncharacterized protein n=1 Tax=Candidatus Competibacter denitrificans Run_A_D11 TaxID=1400863 RepID=W6M1D1_9GAMM|nr:hypothetical protein BN873_140019 [Candidatus Competibacter denitrificans Run_A_D11]
MQTTEGKSPCRDQQREEKLNGRYFPGDLFCAHDRIGSNSLGAVSRGHSYNYGCLFLVFLFYATVERFFKNSLPDLS